MGTAQRPGKVKLFIGLISNNEELFNKVKLTLEKRLKNIVDLESDTLDFFHTDYYDEEMGQRLKRKFLSFTKSIPLKNIEKIKLLTNKIETLFSINGKRTINIDPGCLDLSKVVLFSRKDYSHRIHIGKGIFAEATLFFKDKKFNPWPWTYPDYKTDAYLNVFYSIRELYKKDRDN